MINKIILLATPYHYLLGRVYSRSGNWKKARSRFKSLTDIQPDNPQWHYRLGYVQFKNRQWRHAQNSFQNAIKLNEKNHKYHYRLGLSAEKLNNYTLAESAFKNALLLSERPIYKLKLSNSLLRQERWKNALATIDTSTELSKSIRRRYCLIAAESYEGIKDHFNAAKQFKQSSSLSTTNTQKVWAEFNAGRNFKEAGDTSSADKSFNAAESFDEMYDSKTLGVGILYEKKNLFNEAIGAYTNRKAILKDKNSIPELYWRLGECYSHSGKHKDSISFYSKYIQLLGSNAKHIHSLKLGVAYEQSGQYKKAATHYKICVKAFPNQSHTFEYRLAESLRRINKYKEASTAFLNAQEMFDLQNIQPNGPVAIHKYKKGKLLYQNGKYKKACSLLSSLRLSEEVSLYTEVINSKRLREFKLSANVDTYIKSISAYLRQGELSNAEAFTVQALNTTENSEDLLNLYYKVAEKAAEKSSALKDYVNTVKALESILNSGHLDRAPLRLYRKLSRAHLSNKDPEKSLLVSSEGLKHFPGDMVLRVNRTLAICESGNLIEGIEEWDSLYEMYGEALPLNQFINASKANFEADKYGASMHWIDRAEKIYPDNISLKVFRFTKLSSLVRGGFSEFIVFGESARAQYYTVSNLRKIHKTGLELVCDAPHRNNRIVRSWFIEISLLLFDYQFNHGLDKEASKTLRNILNSLETKLPATLINCTINTILSKRASSKDWANQSNILKDQLSNTPHKKLSSDTWIALHDILISNGLMICSLIAREKSSDNTLDTTLRHAQSEQHLRRLIRTNIDRGEISEVKRTLEKLHSTQSKQEITEVGAFIELLTNKSPLSPETPRDLFKKPHTAFSRLIKGRSVAIVGPAPDGELLGGEIDGYDIVVRFNYMNKASISNHKEFGERVDITYQSGSNIRLFFHAQPIHDVKMYALRYPVDPHTLEHVKSGQAKPYIKGHSLILRKGPNAVPNAVYDILKFNPSKVKVFKSNFYMSSTPYSANYAGRSDTVETTAEEDKIPLNKLQEMTSAHDLISQRRFMKLLWQRGIIDIDKTCERVLRVSDYDYMEYMQGLFKNT